MEPPSGRRTTSALSIDIVAFHDTTNVTFRGRADESNRDQFLHALRLVERDATKGVRLSLRDLEFCDVDAVFDLLTFADEFRRRGRVLSVVDANVWVVAMLVLLDVGGETVRALPPHALDGRPAAPAFAADPVWLAHDALLNMYPVFPERAEHAYGAGVSERPRQDSGQRQTD